MRRSVELLEPRADTQGIDLRLDLDEDLPPWVRGDPVRLRQVLLNLLANAIKFTSEGQVSVRVERWPDEAGEDLASISFIVQDTGVGIAPEAQSRVFLPFTQADSSTTRRFGGTGLGLAICKQIVEHAGGEIGLESTPGSGSTFWFTMRFEIVSPPHVEEETASSPVGWRPSSSRRILLAEDDAVGRMIAVRQIRDLGYRVDAVTNGYEVLEALQERDYDLVLMDCQMPGLDGYETTRRIRRRESDRSHLPIVAATAHAMSGDREKCLAAGMDDYLAKPYRREALAEVLHTWLSGQADAVETSRSVEDEQDDGPLDAATIDALSELGDLLPRAARSFLDHRVSVVSKMRDAVADGDIARLADVAHRLKGSAGALGALRLAELCTELDAEIRAERLDALEGRLGVVERELERVEAALQELL